MSNLEYTRADVRYLEWLETAKSHALPPANLRRQKLVRWDEAAGSWLPTDLGRRVVKDVLWLERGDA